MGLLTLTVSGAQAAGLCTSVFQEKSVFGASDITEQTLPDLIGAQISYTGKYVFRDSTDHRKVSGRGIVQSATLWLKDRTPTFSIKYLNEKGVLFHTQVEFVDPTFKLKIEKRSPFAKFAQDAQEAGLQLKRMQVSSSDLVLADFLRQPENQTLKLLAIVPGPNPSQPFVVREISSTATVVPSPAEILLSFDKGVDYGFKTPEGVLILSARNIIAIAY